LYSRINEKLVEKWGIRSGPKFCSVKLYGYLTKITQGLRKGSDLVIKVGTDGRIIGHEQVV